MLEMTKKRRLGVAGGQRWGTETQFVYSLFGGTNKVKFDL